MATVLKFEVPGHAPAAAPQPVPSGVKAWVSAQEIAELCLPGMPRIKRKVNELARREKWAFRVAQDGSPLARPRAGRGGGLEYHIDLLPPAARSAMLASGPDALFAAPDADPVDRSIWHWFERQSDKVKIEANARLAIVNHVGQFEHAGMTRSAAVAVVSSEHRVSPATLWKWLQLVGGVPASDHLPHLAPRWQGGGKEVPVDPDVWQLVISDYLRFERPTWESCYWRAKRFAEANDRPIPSSRTLFRKLEREIDPRLVIAKREGMDALRGTMPPQTRTVAEFQALELVNIDGHRWDVFVRMPDGRVMRPTMVAIQDIYSRKILAYRLGETESAVLTRLAFADLFKNFGIPGGCLLDNGRAFASKWITGGSKSRFRFKIRDEEPTGILTALNVKIHWAKPYRGSSKPIERAFRDIEEYVGKDPHFAGAYTGNRPDAKPENYGEKAIPFDVFERLVAAGIAAHNARGGRRTETAHGRSFDDVFNESYATAPIGQATPDQLRMALLAADEVRSDRRNGSIELYGNRYWSDELSLIAGQNVTVRFDPDNLHSEIHVYDRAGAYLVTAPILQKTGFLDVETARTRAKAEGDLKKAMRRQAELTELLNAQDIAAMLPDDLPGNDLPPARVIRAVRHRGQSAAALKLASEAPLTKPQDAQNLSAIDRLASMAERHLRSVE